MKNLCRILVLGCICYAYQAMAEDTPSQTNGTSKPAGGVDVNVLDGIRVRVGNAGNAANGVRVDVPGVNVRVGGGNDAAVPVQAKQPFIGLFADPVPEALAAQLGELLEKGNGLLVVEVIAGSPADKSGIKPHDVLVAYDGTPVMSHDQLRDLIRADHPGRTTKIDIIRASQRFSIGVKIAERIVQLPPAPTADETPVSIQVFGRRIIVGRHGVNAPGTIIRWGTPAEVDASHLRPSTCSVTVERRDAASWNVFVTYSGPDDQVNERRLEGASEAIRNRLDEFPPTVGDQVRRTLDRAESEKSPNQNVRVNVQPRVQGADRGLHITIQRPGQAGGPRIFEFDHVFGGEKRVQVGDLLKVSVFAEELRELAPAVREQVEETLRDVELPEVRVEVRESL